jgi:hypothetical protein
MSFAQGQAATSDQENYWLCVVALEPTEPIAILGSSDIEKVARFVPKIGATLVVSSAGIDSALIGAAAGGFELQHVEEIRYGINHAMWETGGILLTDFVEALVREISTL